MESVAEKNGKGRIGEGNKNTLSYSFVEKRSRKMMQLLRPCFLFTMGETSACLYISGYDLAMKVLEP